MNLKILKSKIKNLFSNKNKIMTKNMKISLIAQELCVVNNAVTTLEVKNELRKRYPKEKWNQEYVSNVMNDLYDKDMFTWNSSVAGYRIYSLKKPPVGIKEKNTNKRYISRTKAIDVIENTKGKFFKVKFIKKDNSERDMLCQYDSKIKKSPLGYMNLKDVVAIRRGEDRQIKSVNLQTLMEIKVDGILYKIK